MAWFKVDDGLPDHRKVRRLGRDKVAAVGVWTLCGAWSSRALTDGFVPREIVQPLDPRERLAGRLVEVGLWLPAEHDGEHGYQFHDWADSNPTKADVEARRADTRKRVASHRSGRSRNGHEPPPDGGGGGTPGRSDTDPDGSGNARGNALHDEPVTDPVTPMYSGAGAPAQAARPGPSHPNPGAASQLPPRAGGGRHGSRLREHPTPAELNATAVSAAGYRLVADWAKSNPGLLGPKRRMLAKAVDLLLGQGADPALIGPALDAAHDPRWRSPIAALPHAYDDVRRAARRALDPHPAQPENANDARIREFLRGSLADPQSAIEEAT